MELYKQGAEAYKQGVYDTAADFLSRVSCLAYEPPGFMLTLGCYQAIRINPQHAEAYHARAMVYRKMGRVKDGLEDAKMVVHLKRDLHKVSPSCVGTRLLTEAHKRCYSRQGYLEAGRLCALAGRMEKAEVMLLKAQEKAGEQSLPLSTVRNLLLQH